MAVQVSYPGVYIEEFTPGAPIEGVGTSTAAFIGTALQGPFNKPTLVQSWDDFTRVFGGFIAEQPRSFLVPAVYGFFHNGGTACYVLRVGTGVKALANLDSRQASQRPAPILIGRARDEGDVGNVITVQVIETSRLATNLKILDSTSKGVLNVSRVEVNVSNMSSDRLRLTVGDNTGFAVDDRILITKTGSGGATANGTIKSLERKDTLVLTVPISGSANFGTGTVKVRTADLVPGQRRLRLTTPSGFQLSQSLPRGTAVKIKLGNAEEIHIVDSAGGDTVTLRDGLANTYSLQSAKEVPTLASLEIDLVVSSPALAKPEEFHLVAMHPEHPNYWGSVVTSDLVILEEPASPPNPMPDDSRPVAKTFNLAHGQPDDRAAALTLIKQDPTSYLDHFKPYDDISIVAIPGITDKAVQQAVIAHCETMRDRFAILDSLPGAQPGNGIRTQFADVRSEKGFAALYYPWIVVRNPLTGKDEQWPPSGHIAGIYARTDAQEGVHKAPANANIIGALGLEQLLTDDEQGPLNLMGINVLRVFQGRSQPIVWGARTTAGDLDRNWQYINVRRLFTFIEESIQENIRWAVFQPNNLQLWQKLKRTISEFLTRVWRDGALFGKTAQDAFYVRIDEALNPPSTQALGRLYIEIGVRPSYPAEFIVVRIGIWQGGSEIAET